MVVTVARESWPWAFRLTERDLHDGPSALEIVEVVATEVSRRLQVQPEIGCHLGAYYRLAFARRIRAISDRNGRVEYQGTPQDLETNYKPSAQDWVTVVEDRMCLDALLCHATHTTRLLLRYRVLDYSWKEIGEHLTLTAKQAKSRFYYGLRLAHQRLIAEQERRRF
jgi:DNA-directed RNA polymerase specialized sigma24 family protein